MGPSARPTHDRRPPPSSSGYFESREGVWEEPIYRNVWGLLTEFGDAEIASLIAPRSLVIEACAAPEISGPPAVRPGRQGGAAPGRIRNAPAAAVAAEMKRARHFYVPLNAAAQLAMVERSLFDHGFKLQLGSGVGAALAELGDWSDA